MSPVAPRIVNDVSYVTDINHESHLEFGEVGEIRTDSRSAKCCNFHYKMRCRGGKSNRGERAGSILPFHARIMFGSCSNRPPL